MSLIPNTLEKEIPRRKKLEELEGLRGLCSIAVLITHVVYGTIHSPNISSLPLFFLTIVSSFGHLAVLIFFVLSGFVIGYSNPKEFSKKNLIDYLLKRLIRIYPIYLLAVLYSFSLLDTHFSWSDLFSHLLFLQTWTLPAVTTNGPIWSLSFEMFFYLLFVITWASNFSLEKSIIICVSFSILSELSSFHPFKILGYYSLWLMGLWLARNYHDLPTLNSKNTSYRFWASVMIAFVFGWANIYDPVVSKLAKNQVNFMPDLPSIFSDIIISGLVLSIIASLLKKKSPYFNLSFILAVFGIVSSLIYAWVNGLFGLIINYKIALILFCFSPFTYLIKDIPHRFMIFCAPLGAISYSIYVIHEPTRILFYRIFNIEGKSLADIAPWLLNLGLVVVVFLVAWVLEVYIQPILSRKLKYYLIRP